MDKRAVKWALEQVVVNPALVSRQEMSVAVGEIVNGGWASEQLMMAAALVKASHERYCRVQAEEPAPGYRWVAVRAESELRNAHQVLLGVVESEYYRGKRYG